MSSFQKWKGMSQFVYHFQLSWGAIVLRTTLALASASASKFQCVEVIKTSLFTDP